MRLFYGNVNDAPKMSFRGAQRREILNFGNLQRFKISPFEMTKLLTELQPNNLPINDLNVASKNITYVLNTRSDRSRPDFPAILLELKNAIFEACECI